jgi:cytochrome P450
LSGDGPVWAHRRKLIQPLFTAPNVDSLTAQMALAIGTAVDTLARSLREGQSVDSNIEMTRIVQRAANSAFFGERVTEETGDRLGGAISAAFSSLGSRMLLPFVPNSVPMPGDRTFRRSVRDVDEVMVPVIHRALGSSEGRNDIVSRLSCARDENNAGLSERELRDDVVGIFVAGTDTSVVSLTWLWVILDSHPEVAAKLSEEIERVVGRDLPGREHLAQLTYTKMVLQELLRLRPPAWMIPRRLVAEDVFDGVRVPGGSTVLMSPYLTQRMGSLWENPLAFDPERFSPERMQRRHRFAFFPFGGGGHKCVGMHLFMVEAQLIIATLLSRYRIELHGTRDIEPQAAVTLKTRQKVQLILRPNG